MYELCAGGGMCWCFFAHVRNSCTAGVQVEASLPDVATGAGVCCTAVLGADAYLSLT